MFIGFGIRPEWPPSVPLNPHDIHLDVTATRQFEQYPEFRDIVDKIVRIIQEELAVHHILAYSRKLDQVTPGAGYALNPDTGRITLDAIRLSQPSVNATQDHDTTSHQPSVAMRSQQTGESTTASPSQRSCSGETAQCKL